VLIKSGEPPTESNYDYQMTRYAQRISGNIIGTFRELSRNFQGTFKEHKKKSGNFRKIQGTI
jgi:hypothetical protein